MTAVPAQRTAGVPARHTAARSRVRALAALAVADFFERTRRPSYLVTLTVAVGLGYLALPPAAFRYVIMNAGGYRGVDNSAWAGTVTALAGTLWLMGGGFYVVRSAIARDQRTGVGQILAATPLRSAGYLAAKFASNLMVLASMAAVLAMTALVTQLTRGESATIAPGALLLPYVLFPLPVLALTAAAAILVETVPVLRSGMGNIAWLVAWLIFAISGHGVPLGFGAVSSSMRQAMAAEQLRPTEFSVGFTQIAHPLRTFTWHGLAPSAGFITARLMLLAAFCCLAIIPAAWFGRFDPARGRPRRIPARGGEPLAPLAEPAMPAGANAAQLRQLAYRPLPPGRIRPGAAVARLLAGESRILVQGIPAWWWLVAAAIDVAGLAVPPALVKPEGDSTALLLSAAWIWPVLIWSRLGANRRENGLDTLLGAYPGPYRQLTAEWLAGLALTAAVGLGPLVRMVTAADGARAAAWFAGVLFIPSLALLLGTASRTQRVFQVGYVLLWYAAVNKLTAADYMGTILVHGHPAGPSPQFTAGTAVAMLGAAFAIRGAQRATR